MHGKSQVYLPRINKISQPAFHIWQSASSIPRTWKRALSQDFNALGGNLSFQNPEDGPGWMKSTLSTTLLKLNIYKYEYHGQDICVVVKSLLAVLYSRGETQLACFCVIGCS